MTRPQGDSVIENGNILSCTNSSGNTTDVNNKQLGVKCSPRTELHYQIIDGCCRSTHRSIASSLNRFERNKRKCTLQQVIASRKQKIYEQQCEIEELRRRIREVCTDNRFLREQNYWQGRSLEKLDGKHAELPQLINGHLEEIRVYREQIKRSREVIKIEKQRRNDADAAKEKTFHELKHLRKLAEEQKLIEKDDLVRTIEKLQNEAGEREKQISSLEKYAENLEKNLRYESVRSVKCQKETKNTCERLLNRITELEQSVQEKQKLIELSNIYSKRSVRSHRASSQHEVQSTVQVANADSSGNTESHDRRSVEGEQLKPKIRERIKEFDLRRQEMQKKREKARKERLNCADDCIVREAGDDEKYDDDHDASNSYIEDVNDYPQPSASICNLFRLETRIANNFDGPNQKNKYSNISLPRIRSSDGGEKTESLIKRTKGFGEYKQVRFNTPDSSLTRTLAEDDRVLKSLRAKERQARASAEACLPDTRFLRDKDTVLQPANQVIKIPNEAWTEHYPDGQFHQYNMNSNVKHKAILANGEIDVYRDLDIGSSQTVRSNSSQASHPVNPIPVSPTKSASLLHTASPLEPQTTSDLSSFDSFELTPLPNSMLHICRPFGDHDMDYYLPGDTPTPTSGATAVVSDDDSGVDREQEKALMCAELDDMVAWNDTPLATHIVSSTPSNPLIVEQHHGESDKETMKILDVSLGGDGGAISQENSSVGANTTPNKSTCDKGQPKYPKHSPRTTTLYAVIKKKAV